MSTANWVAGMGSGAVSGAALGATYTANPWGAVIGGVLGAGSGAFGASEADRVEKKNTAIANSDPTTPYKVTLPSGATVTMYAHGKRSGLQDPNPNATSKIIDASLSTAATLANTKTKSPNATKTAVAPADAVVANADYGTMEESPWEKQYWAEQKSMRGSL